MAAENVTFAEGMATNATEVENNNTVHLPEVSLERKIWFYSYLFFTPVGVVLNLTSVVVLCILKEHKRCLGLKMIFLALADSVFIGGMCLFLINNMYSTHRIIPNIIGMSKTFCLLTSTLFLHTGVTCSSTFLAAITVERYLIIAFPLRVKAWNLLRFTIIFFCAVFIISFLSSIPMIFALDVVERGTIELCKLKAGARHHFINIMYVQNAVNGTNTVIIATFTFLICLCLAKARKWRHDMTNSVQRTESDFKVSVMVVVVASLFVLTRTPQLVLSVIMEENIKRGNTDTTFFRNAMKYYPFGDLFVLVNHSVNFFVYFAFLKKFRQVLLRCRCSTATPAAMATFPRKQLSSVTGTSDETNVENRNTDQLDGPPENPPCSASCGTQAGNYI